MIFDTKSVGMASEILADNDYRPIPFKVTETTTVKAGMPMTNEGKKSTNGEGAIGILLYDVDPTRNPNCALVVEGSINWEKCQANNSDELSSLTAENASKAMPHLVFRDKISSGESKTYVGGAASEAV